MLTWVYQEGLVLQPHIEAVGGHWPMASVCHGLNDPSDSRSPAELDLVSPAPHSAHWPVPCLHCSRQQQVPKRIYAHLPPAQRAEKKKNTLKKKIPSPLLFVLGVLASVLPPN